MSFRDFAKEIAKTRKSEPTMRSKNAVIKVIAGLQDNACQRCQPDRPRKADEFSHQIASDQNLLKEALRSAYARKTAGMADEYIFRIAIRNLRTVPEINQANGSRNKT